jgi:hypothetical protein
VDRRAGLLALPTRLLLAESAPPAVVRADPPRSAFCHRLANVTGLVEEEPVPELWVVLVGVEQGAGPVSLLEVGIGHRSSEPAVVGLTRDLEDPARHRDGDTVLGQLADERLHHFPGRLACDR